mmetsp:Transcript_32261/g.57884  ORF Transcript_32261/g.57884 Transcript_32261/m.57884 type:complete len:106 (+) Transcript_32261:369-686(+)
MHPQFQLARDCIPSSSFALQGGAHLWLLSRSCLLQCGESEGSKNGTTKQAATMTNPGMHELQPKPERNTLDPLIVSRWTATCMDPHQSTLVEFVESFWRIYKPSE